MPNTTIEEALGKLKKYQEIVRIHLPKEKVNCRKNCQEDCTIYETLEGACVEALVVLDGDEEKFKECLAAIRKRYSGMGWGFDFDEDSFQRAAQDMKTLAYLLRKD